VANRPLRLRRRGGEVVTVAATVERVRDPNGELAALRWMLRPLGPEDRTGPPLPAEEAAEQDRARRDHLAAPEILDPAADLDGTLQAVLDAGVRLPGVDRVGLMLADGRGRLCAAGGSDQAALSFLRAQEHTLKGPCVHAFLLERAVRSASVGDDPRWPRLVEAAAVHRVGAALAAPIGLYGGPVGACLAVSEVPRAWSDGDVAAAQAYASVLAVTLELAAEVQGGDGE